MLPANCSVVELYAARFFRKLNGLLRKRLLFAGEKSLLSVKIVKRAWKFFDIRKISFLKSCLVSTKKIKITQKSLKNYIYELKMTHRNVK